MIPFDFTKFDGWIERLKTAKHTQDRLCGGENTGCCLGIGLLHLGATVEEFPLTAHKINYEGGTYIYYPPYQALEELVPREWIVATSEGSDIRLSESAVALSADELDGSTRNRISYVNDNSENFDLVIKILLLMKKEHIDGTIQF